MQALQALTAHHCMEVDIQELYKHKKWCFDKADWFKFANICHESAELSSMEGNIEECANEVTQLIHNAALNSIPIKEIEGKRKIVPWWNEECTKAIKSRNKAFRELRKNLSQDNVIEYQKKRAIARRTIKSSKRKAWRDFCSTIGREVEIGKVWAMFKKMSGKTANTKIPVLTEERKMAITNKEKANLLGENFAKVHSGNHLDEKHRQRKEAALRNYKDVHQMKNREENTLDAEITMYELQLALQGVKKSATGEDQLSYAMFQKLPDQALRLVLTLFNKIWNEGKLPKNWKSAVILPFNKPGKDPTNAGNYRPIALTSHLCKWMEKILVSRLNYFLELNGLIAPYQSGFRKGRSTMDAVVKVSNDIEKTFKMKETMAIVFYDIEKAYDSMWREGLLIKLNRMGVRGRFYNWVLDFLTDRRFKVKVGSEMSEEFNIVNGIPQGSVISPVLFNVMINDIFMNVDRRIGSALYADDGAVWVRGRNTKHVMGIMKKAIKEVEEWSYNWGFKLSVSKSCYMIFSKKRGVGNQNLTLYGQNMERVDHFKYLGVWLDEKGTWKTHVEKVECKCKKVNNLMRAVVGKQWGADKQALMYIYRALMRSKIDYGSFVYGAAAQTHLNKLDRVQVKALRICTGAIRTTPIKALQIEAGEAPIDLRRDKLMLTYWSRLRGCGKENPAKDAIQDCWEYAKFKDRGFGWTANNKAKEYSIGNIQFNSPTPKSSIPPWLFPKPDINLNILELKKDWMNSEKGEKASAYIKNNYINCIQIYTDGSKDERDRVGTGVFIPEKNIKIAKRIPDKLSVYTSEMVAVILGLQWVENVRPDKVVICVDSVSVLLSLQSLKSSREDLLMEIHQSLYRLYSTRIKVSFCWVPAHVGIEGNEKADTVAKSSLELIEIMKLPFSKGEAKAILKEEMNKKWQNSWDSDSKGRTYYNIQKSISAQGVMRVNRREEVVMTRLRLDHTGLNKTLFIMGKSNSDKCAECNSIENTEHVLMHCKKYREARIRLKQKMVKTGRRWDLVGLLGTTGAKVQQKNSVVIEFLKEAEIYHRI